MTNTRRAAAARGIRTPGDDARPLRGRHATGRMRHKSVTVPSKYGHGCLSAECAGR